MLLGEHPRPEAVESDASSLGLEQSADHPILEFALSMLEEDEDGRLSWREDSADALFAELQALFGTVELPMAVDALLRLATMLAVSGPEAPALTRVLLEAVDHPRVLSSLRALLRVTTEAQDGHGATQERAEAFRDFAGHPLRALPSYEDEEPPSGSVRIDALAPRRRI